VPRDSLHRVDVQMNIGEVPQVILTFHAAGLEIEHGKDVEHFGEVTSFGDERRTYTELPTADEVRGILKEDDDAPA